MGGKIGKGIKNAWGSGVQFYDNNHKNIGAGIQTIGSIAESVAPEYGEIGKSIANIGGVIEGNNSEQGWDHVKHHVKRQLGAANGTMGTVRKNVQSLMNNPAVQTFVHSPGGQAVVGRVKRTAHQMASQIGISPQHQRNAVESLQHLTDGQRKQLYGVHVQGGGAGVYHNPLMQNITQSNSGLYGSRY